MNKDLTLLLIRLIFSGCMLTHGIPKFLNLISERPKFFDPIGIGEIPSLILAVIGEAIAPIFIIIGYKVRFSSLFPIVTMFIAAFVVHFDDPFKKKELALLYLTGFLIILIMGPGRYSINKK